MLDYQRLIDDIRGVVFALGSVDSTLLARLSAEYAEACEQVNTRLRHTASLLRKGLRSEAIQAADIAPNLIDSYATLDFPDLPTWTQILARAGITSLPMLLADDAADLNRAYAEQQPLEQLLRRHRLLALQQASLAQRLSVLRKIAELDPANPIWHDDILSYERARFAQIDQELRDPARPPTAERTAELLEELSSDRWRENPPSSLLQRATDICNTQEAHRAIVELATLAPLLHAAHGELDFDRGQELAARWREAESASGG